jgi:O-antigen ligase
MLVGAFGLLLLLRQPALGLVGLIVASLFVPFEIGTGTDVAVNATMLVIPVLLAVGLLDVFRHRTTVQLARSRTMVPLMGFLLAATLSLIAGNAFWDSSVPRPGNILLVQLGQWSLFVLSAAAYLLVGNLIREVKWLRVLVGAFVVLGTAALAGRLVPGLSRRAWQVVIVDATGSLFWVWLVALICGQLVFNDHLEMRGRFLLVAALAIIMYSGLGRQKEWLSAWLPSVVALLFIIFLRVWQRSHKLGVATVVVSVVFAVIFYPYLYTYAGGEQEYNSSLLSRLALYRVVIEMASQRPILGLGLAAYRHYGWAQPLAFGNALWFRPNISSHNNYIDIFAQTGLLGLGFFVWFIVEVGLLGSRLRDRFSGFARGYVYGALGGLIGTLVACLLVDWFLPFVYNVGFKGFRSSVFGWLFLGGLVALEQMVKVENRDGEIRVKSLEDIAE